jgi:hypothetical protein
MAENEMSQPVPRDEADMAICAIRYCIGRQSYATSDGQRWARNYGARSTHVRTVIIRDLQSEIEQTDRLREAGHENGTLGMKMDEDGWRQTLADLRGMA